MNLDKMRSAQKSNQAILRDVAENPLKDGPAPSITTVTVPQKAVKPAKERPETVRT